MPSRDPLPTLSLAHPGVCWGAEDRQPWHVSPGPTGLLRSTWALSLHTPLEPAGASPSHSGRLSALH